MARRAAGGAPRAARGGVFAVPGATGEVGRLVVADLLARGLPVRALVRDPEKARAVLPAEALAEGLLETVECDLSDVASVRAALGPETSRVLWCALGDGRERSRAENAKGTVGTALRALKMKLGLGQKSAPTSLPEVQPDAQTGLDAAAAAMSEREGGKVVFLSSAAVTRPAWADWKKDQFIGVVDIPIVRLNPFGVLDRTRLAENRLRGAGCAYSVVRPVGLRNSTGKKSWPRGRPLVLQGDVLVGRANREDVASVLVEAALSQEADRKSFEMCTLAGDAYPAPGDFGPAFSRLLSDEQRATMGEDVGFGASEPTAAGEAFVQGQYLLAAQLLPGEAQDATKLEMGRTYEEVDQGKVSRERGAAPTEREVRVATAGEAR